MVEHSNINTKPMMPKFGETFQGFYPNLPDLPHTNIFMESDYTEHIVKDLLFSSFMDKPIA